MTSVFYLFRDAPHRRAALGLEPGSPARYALYGMDELAERGHTVRHNLERPEPAAWARVTGAALKRGLEAAGGYGGDFAGVLSSQRELNRADVVLSTVARPSSATRASTASGPSEAAVDHESVASTRGPSPTTAHLMLVPPRSSPRRRVRGRPRRFVPLDIPPVSRLGCNLSTQLDGCLTDTISQ